MTTQPPHTMISFGLCKSCLGYARQEEIFAAKVPGSPSRWAIYRTTVGVDPRDVWAGQELIGSTLTMRVSTRTFPSLRAALGGAK